MEENKQTNKQKHHNKAKVILLNPTQYVPFPFRGNCFFLVKTISFSTLFTFPNFSYDNIYIYELFSQDLHRYNLNNSRMCLIKTFLFLKMDSLIVESLISEMAVCGVEVGKIKLF